MSIHATSTEVYTGKNLYNPTISPTTAYGVTGVGTVNGFTLNGTANANGYRLGFNSATLPAGTYTVTVYYDSGTHSGGTIPFILYKTGTWTSVTTFYAMSFSPASTPGSRTTTFTLSEETEVTLYVYFGTDPTFPTFTDFKCRVQVESGSTATSYEPYVGGVPSPLISGVTHVSTSKNLLNMQSDSNGEYLGTTSQQTYSGKNLIVYPYSTRAPFTNGITFTSNNDGTVIIDGQNDNVGNSAFFLYSSTPGDFTLPAGTYYFLRPSNTAVQFVAYDGTNYWNFTSENNYSRTFNSSITFQTVYIQVPRGNTTVFNNLKVYPMLSTLPNQTQDDYEPYVGGVPSPNPDYPQEIVTGKLKSKNLYALSKTNGTSATVSYTYNSDGTFSLSGTATANGDFSIILPTAQSGITSGQTYSLWSDHALGWGDNSVSCYIQGCTEDGTWLGNLAIYQANTSQAIPTITSQYIKFVLVFRANTRFDNYNNVKIQLVKGDTYDTNFEPYFTPIELAQIGNYQDKAYKSGDDWYTRKETDKVILDGTENWVGSSTSGYTYTRGLLADFAPVGSSCYCNMFTQRTGSHGQYEYIWIQPTTGSLYLQVSDSRLSEHTLGAFKTWLETNKPVVYSVLATATNTAITDPTTIAWLNKYDTDALPHHKYVNTRKTTYVGASGLASAIDLYDGSYASALPTYSTANDHHLTTANGGTYTVSLQNISASIISGTVTFSVFTNQRKIDFSWNGSATSTNVSVSLQADEYIKSIYAYIPQNADAGITLSQQLESGSLTDFEPYYNIVKIYAGDDLIFEDTSLTE